MSQLPMYQNVLACYPALLERLAKVPGVHQVLEAADLEALSSDKRLKPIDGAVYVVFDGFTPDADAATRQLLRERLSFSVILTKRQYNPGHMQYGADGVGETITAIKAARSRSTHSARAPRCRLCITRAMRFFRCALRPPWPSN